MARSLTHARRTRTHALCQTLAQAKHKAAEAEGGLPFVPKVPGPHLLLLPAAASSSQQQQQQAGLLLAANGAISNPALEFVKQSCQLLALDEPVHDTVARVKQNLLARLGVRAFSAQAQFVNPCGAPFVLPDGAACALCGAVRDLDLTRDTALIDTIQRVAAVSLESATAAAAAGAAVSGGGGGNAGGVGGGGGGEQLDGGAALAAAAATVPWSCGQCGHALGKARIEAALVEYVFRRSVAYQVQVLIHLRGKRCEFFAS